MKKNKISMLYFLLGTLEMMSFVYATSRPFASSSSASTHKVSQLAQITTFDQSKKVVSQQQYAKKKVVAVFYGSGERFRGLSRLGSRPPNCERKCKGCVPCNAIQIPATSDQMSLHYANYEPEGWKCKCGSSFFNP